MALHRSSVTWGVLGYLNGLLSVVMDICRNPNWQCRILGIFKAYVDDSEPDLGLSDAGLAFSKPAHSGRQAAVLEHLAFVLISCTVVVFGLLYRSNSLVRLPYKAILISVGS